VKTGSPMLAQLDRSIAVSVVALSLFSVYFAVFSLTSLFHLVVEACLQYISILMHVSGFKRSFFNL